VPPEFGACRRAAALVAVVVCLLPASALAILDGSEPDRESEIAGGTVAIVVEDTSKPGPDGRPGYYPSSGIVVARDWILTVKHAFADHIAPQFRWQLRFARDVSAAPTADRVHPIGRSDVVYHPALDLALIHVSGGVPFEYRPVRLVVSAKQLRSELPVVALLAGFGPADNKGGINILRYVEEPVSAMVVRHGNRWPDQLIPSNQGRYYLELDQRDGRGSCKGDSGGPVFMRLTDGNLGLIGVIKGNASYTGSHPCLGYSYAVRADLAVEWLTQVTGRFYDPASMLLVDVR
jgi:hypothetical protein